MIDKYGRIIFVLSLCGLVVAIIMAAWGFPEIVKNQIKKNVQIDTDSPMYEKWRKLPIPLTFKVYVFNVTNPEEVNNGERAVLAEVGPYVYEQYREKTVLGYGANDTIKYMLKKTFIFNKNMSGALSEDDVLTVINLPYMASILTVYDMMPSMVGMVNEALGAFFPNMTDPFLRTRTGDFLFDGVFLSCESEISALKLVCGKIKSDALPTMRPAEDGKGFYFSMFGHMNHTESGPYEMVRGTENVYKLGHIVSYKGKTSMDVWGDPFCGQLNGSDSSINPPIDSSHVPERLYIFEPDICRSIYVNLVGKATLLELPTYYYEISRNALASKSAEPANKCFCRKNWSANHDGCLLMGLMNLMPCQGAPVIVSLPHYYLGSEELLDYIEEGLQPDKEKHNTYVYIEPTTGVVLKGLRRFQFNIELRNIKAVPQLEKVPTGLFPVIWIEEGAELTPSLLEELRDARTKLGYVEIIRWLLLVIGVAVFLGSAVALLRSGSFMVWPGSCNSVSFIMRPGTFNDGENGNKVH